VNNRWRTVDSGVCKGLNLVDPAEAGFAERRVGLCHATPLRRISFGVPGASSGTPRHAAFGARLSRLLSPPLAGLPFGAPGWFL